MPPVVTPPMRKGSIPPFHDLGEMPFQAFCRDLLDDLENYKECRVFGTRGQKQYGIDIRCVKSGGGIEVAQCKCYKEFTEDHIKKASNEFLPHVDYWLSKGVKRFILIVACSIETTQAIEQIDIETKRFEEYNIQYELWDAVKLRKLLRDLPKVVNTHIQPSDYWIKELCGDQYKSAYDSKNSYGINLVTNTLVDNLNQLSALFTSKASRELEEKRELFRQGKLKEVSDWITHLRANEVEWLAISPEIRASILRFEAIINIDCGEDFSRAEQLLNEAKEMDPDGFDQRVRALLALHEQGPQAALDVINGAQDLDSLCLQASLLLQLGRQKEAISTLELLQVQENAEVFRLLALAYLNDRNLEKAIESITKAKAINSQWESVQLADAVVSYFSALSPVAFKETHFLWPVPIGLELVKSTDEAIHALEHAAKIFIKIAQNEQRKEAFRLSLRIWYAACLACDFRKQNEAEKEFSNLLAESPTDHRLISWILSRGYAISLERSHQELKRLRKSGSVTSENVVSSVMLDIHDKRTRNTLHLIDTNRQKLIEEENERFVDYWSIQVLIARKMFPVARKRLESSRYRRELEPLYLLLLQQEANASKNFQPFVDYLVHSVETDQDALLLLELCHFHALQHQWNDIARYAEKLVSEIQTTEALKLASAALYNLRQYTECKEFLEKYKYLCFENLLPSELMLMYIRCKAFSGEFPEALSDLRQLTESNPTKQNLLLLRDFYILKGDKSGLRDIASLVKKQSDFKPDDLISFASSLLWASPELAKEFLKMAPSDQLSSQHIVEKMMLGFSLGLDSEIKDIHSLFPEILESEDAPIRIVSLEETIEIIKQRNQLRNELLSQYSAGELPIHFLAKDSASNLFALYKKALQNNSSVPPSQKFPIYIRYGGRPSLSDFKEPEPLSLDLVSLDITSLLLLDHFSLLDIFEREGNPIKLPGETVHALVNMKQALEQYQPDIIQALKLLLEYLNENRVRKIEISSNQFSGDFDNDHLLNMMQSLGSQQGYVVGFSSQESNWNRLSVSNSNLKFITLTDIVDSLRAEGIIAEVDKNITIDQLGGEGLIKTGINVAPGSNLFFVANTIRLLAQTAIFNRVCNAYTVWIESSEVSNIQSALREERDRSTFAASLQNLIDRISKSIEEKKYVFLPHQKLDNKTEALAQEDIFLRNLIDNFHAGQNNIVIPSIDDLFIQKQLHLQGANVIGIYELVWSAYKQMLIDDERYYDILIEFRKADLRYLPISSGELFFHLRRAVIQNNKVQENVNLKILKEYIYSSLLIGRKLDVPFQPFDVLEAVGEFEFIFSFVHSIAYAVTKIWQDNVDEEQKQIRSSWIFENLYLDILTICEVAGWEREPNDHLFLVALGLAEFFLNGLQFPKDDSNNSRKQFYDWFYRNICEPRFNANPGLIEKTAEFIKNSLASQITNHTDSKFGPYIRFFSERLYQDLPFPIKAIIDQDKEFLELIGLQIITVIEIDDFRFPAENLWDKLAQVLEGQPTLIEAVDPSVEILFSPCDVEGKIGATFVHPNHGGKVNVESEDFVFIANANLQAWLDSNSENFIELSKDELEATVSQIYLTSRPAERMDLLNELRKSSIGNYYINIKDELLSDQFLDFGLLLPPSRHSLRQFFDFGLGDTDKINSEELINRSARNLTNRLGLFTAISRITAFPAGIPSFLLDEIQRLPKDEIDRLLTRLEISLITPIDRLHLIKLITRFGNKEQSSKSVQSFFGEEAKIEISAFLLLLGCVTDALHRLPGDEYFSVEEKLLLSWGHANELFRIIKQVSVPLDWLIDVLKEKKSQLPFRYVFSSSPIEWSDVVYAGRMDALSFKILGLNYALEGSSTLQVEEQKLLLQEVFPWKENAALPAIDLLEQRETFTNALNSFFGEDISNALLCLTSGEDERVSTTISSSSLKDLAVQAIEWLSSPASAIAGFQFLYLMYHAEEMPEAFLKDFEKNISKLNFVELVNENPMIAYIGFYFSTCQTKQLSESTRKHLVSQLMELARIGSQLPFDQDNAEGLTYHKTEIIALLFESAIQLIKGMREDLMVDEFSHLLLEIIARWKEAKPIGLRLLNRIYQDVPIPIAHKIGRTLLELRSLR